MSNITIDGGCSTQDGEAKAPRGRLIGGTAELVQADGSTGWQKVDGTSFTVQR